MKIKYPDNPIIALLQKREIIINPDEDGVPVIRVKDYKEDLILSDSGTEISEGKEFFNYQTDVKNFEAYSLVPEPGKYKKIPVTKITKSAEFGSHLFYDDSYCYTFNFPATGKGVKRITKGEFEIKDPFYPLIFFFAGGIPYDSTELTITMPQTVKINFRLFGGDTTSVRSSCSKKGKLITYRWTSHQPKIMQRDFLAPSIRYFRPHLIATIASSISKIDTLRYLGNLDELNKWQLDKIGRVNNTISPEIKQITDSITQNITDTTEKIRAIYKWVQNNIKYIAIEDGDNGFVPREASLVLKRRYGDCKDKSSLLTALITAAGEKASLVSVGTRGLPYKYSEFASIACADHMVAAWWNKDTPVILDGTSRNNKLEDIPAFIQGKECLIQKGNGEYLLYKIPEADGWQNGRNDTIHLALDHDMLTGKGVSVFHGECKSNTTHDLEGKDKEKQLNQFPTVLTSASNKLRMTDISTNDLANTDIPLIVNYQFQLPDYITKQGNQIYINLNIERGISLLDIKEERIIPIEVEFKQNHQIVYSLKIPENMQVTYLPEPYSFSHPMFGFSQKYEQRNNLICMSTSIHIECLLIEGDNLTEFRNMISQLKKAFRQTIALKSEQ